MRRPLKVFAFDPSQGRLLGNHLTIDVPFEPDLKPGPIGKRIAVIDYDGSNECYYEPVDLNHPQVLLSQGLNPNDADPKFHQQMAYAVAWETTSLFERAIGRPIRWRFTRDGKGEPEERDHLRIFPHGMQEANAYYSRKLGALMFGYFANEADVRAGERTPRYVFTCLSHDIVAHETAHALLDVFRPQYLYDTNPDVAAFHEAFADIVALFQHFSVKEALLDTIQRTGGLLHRRDLEPDARSVGAPMIIGEIPGANPLMQLAREFGQAMGGRQELRSALDSPPTPALLAQTLEPHARGSILVASVFDAFFTIFLRRTRDLMSIARAGGGATSAGDLHPDLANRLAAEAAKTASHFTRLCVRALDFCPVADITFGDYLRAIVTADMDAFPDDTYGYREALIQAFVARGIRPEGVTSISESALQWTRAEGSKPGTLDTRTLAKIQLDIDFTRDSNSSVAAATRGFRARRQAFVHAFASRHRRMLGLVRQRPVQVGAVGRSMREHQDGIPRPEYIICLHQQREIPANEASFKFVVRGGSTVVVSHDGCVRYAIHQSVNDKQRAERQRDWLTQRLEGDPRFEYASPQEIMKLWVQKQSLDFAMLHRGY
jgi:quinol monooxygenase YgiN